MNDLFAALYELITGQGTDLSKLLYNEYTYVPVGTLMLLLSAGFMLLYYYALNHPRLNRWYHWIFALIIVCLINFAIAYFMADGVVYDTYGKTDGYVTQMVNFGIANVIWTIAFFFLFSMLFKWKSRNAMHSPF